MRNLLIITFFIPGGAFAQKQTVHLQQIWLGYFTQLQFSEKWSVGADAQLRTMDHFTRDLSQGLLRMGLNYHLSKHTKITVGYAFSNYYPGDNHPDFARPEHRPWQQIQWITQFPSGKLTHGLRLEERFQKKILTASKPGEGYNFNFRLRYSLSYFKALGDPALEKNRWGVVLTDEAMVNFGREVVNNYFDQNRFFAGLSFRTNATDNIQFGYLNIFQQLSQGNAYKQYHNMRISYYQSINLAKRKN